MWSVDHTQCTVTKKKKQTIFVTHLKKIKKFITELSLYKEWLKISAYRKLLIILVNVNVPTRKKCNLFLKGKTLTMLLYFNIRVIQKMFIESKKSIKSPRKSNKSRFLEEMN